MSAPPRHRLTDGGPKYTNRLFWEDSLYLRQHAHNPVDWYPWGKEAFAIAEKLSRPVLLSIGYATCHWCHVMAEESFEDEAIAALMNSRYIAIKVDRELRPDVDYAYITFVQALAGHAGWPLTVWLTPDRNPFAGGTYFPPYDRDGRIGFSTLLAAQADRFVLEGARTVVAEAKQYAARLRELTTRSAPQELPRGTAEALLVETAERFDRKSGGFVGAPKFPSTFPLGPCFRLRARSVAHEAMALETLWAMRNGGLFDQLGYGFHRYSVDAGWRVPHFEKMLYDNALLVRSYLLGGACAPSLDEVAREVLEFLLADFRAPNGTFYAATDADSRDAHGRFEEGVYFTWTTDELVSALGEEQAALAALYYGVSSGGRSALSRPRSIDTLAAELGRERAGLEVELAEVRRKLLAARQQREPPSRDEKQLTSWNALTVSALAQAAFALGDARFAEAALAAAAPFRSALTKGSLPHVLGPRSEAAFGDDIAYLAEALLDLFELTADVTCLKEARAAMEMLERDFLDAVSGSYACSSRSRHEELFLAYDATQDGPTPNVNSVAAMNWARLAGYFADQSLAKRALRTCRAFSATLLRQPLALPGLVEVIDWFSALPPEIVVVIPEGKGALAPAARPFLEALRKLPTRLLVVASEAELKGALGATVPWAGDKRLVGGATTVYLCEGEACRAPITQVEDLDKLLREFSPSPRRASSIIDPAKTPVI